MKLLILGGTGFIGRTLCEHLIRALGADARITVPTRHPLHGQAIQMLPTVQLAQGDVYNPRELEKWVRNQDAVIHLIGRLHGTPAQFEATHVDLLRHLSAACQQAGVSRFIHVSSLGARVDAPSHYLRSKAAGEAVLRSARLALTLLQPSVIFGAQDQFMNRFAHLQALFPIMPLGGAQAKLQPVWVDDVAQAIVHCLQHQRTVGCQFECTGPRAYTLAELVRLAGQWSNHPRPVFALPQPLAHLQALALECWPAPPLLSRDNLASLQADSLPTPGLPGLAELGITPTALETIMPQALQQNGALSLFDTWRVRAGRV